VSGVSACAVWVIVNGGGPSRSLKGGPDERHPVAQVRVRGPDGGVTDAFTLGQQLALDVFDVLHNTQPAGFCDVSSLDSGPSNIGRDGSGRPEWSMNFDLTVDVAAGGPTTDLALAIVDILLAADLGLGAAVSVFASDKPPADR